MTRLSRIHPYPAMIADELAAKLAKEYVKPGYRVLDPFCGTGRTLLAAAEYGGIGIGVDVNPLAVLLVRAKASNPDLKRLEKLLNEFESYHEFRPKTEYNFENGRQVSWFSARAKRELSFIIEFLNQRTLPPRELLLLATILSATTREASYCRCDQWKIHRISQAERAHFKKSAAAIFLKRLKLTIKELKSTPPLQGSCAAFMGNACKLEHVFKKHTSSRTFHLVFTSPPYGDSVSTVQYGGVSNLCLAAVMHLKRLKLPLHNGMSIDSACLGGNLKRRTMNSEQQFSRFWNGTDKRVKNRVGLFLHDLEEACKQAVKIMKPKGRAIFVVARRTVGGSQLKIDRFLIAVMGKLGCACEKIQKRLIKGKLTPYVVDAMGNGKKHKKRKVSTMREEYVLFFKK